MSEPQDFTTATITIRRFLTPDGEDHVDVTSQDGDGDTLSLVEVLGLLDFARFDVYAAAHRDQGDPP